MPTDPSDSPSGTPSKPLSSGLSEEPSREEAARTATTTLAEAVAAAIEQMPTQAQAAPAAADESPAAAEPEAPWWKKQIEKYQFKPGQSGNPGGLSKHQRAMRTALREQITPKIIEVAVRGLTHHSMQIQLDTARVFLPYILAPMAVTVRQKHEGQQQDAAMEILRGLWQQSRQARDGGVLLPSPQSSPLPSRPTLIEATTTITTTTEGVPDDREDESPEVEGVREEQQEEGQEQQREEEQGEQEQEVMAR